MNPKKESSIYAMSKGELLTNYNDFIIDTNLFEKTMEEFTTVMSRVDMGGNEGIHKPTSGNPDRLRR